MYMMQVCATYLWSRLVPLQYVLEFHSGITDSTMCDSQSHFVGLKCRPSTESLRDDTAFLRTFQDRHHRRQRVPDVWSHAGGVVERLSDRIDAVGVVGFITR
jgi:hypothetical protein